MRDPGAILVVAPLAIDSDVVAVVLRDPLRLDRLLQLDNPAFTLHLSTLRPLRRHRSRSERDTQLEAIGKLLHGLVNKVEVAENDVEVLLARHLRAPDELANGDRKRGRGSVCSGRLTTLDAGLDVMCTRGMMMANLAEDSPQHLLSTSGLISTCVA